MSLDAHFDANCLNSDWGSIGVGVAGDVWDWQNLDFGSGVGGLGVSGENALGLSVPDIITTTSTEDTFGDFGFGGFETTLTMSDTDTQGIDHGE